MIVVGFDANNGIFALVEKETDYIWTWFLDCIQRYIISGRTGLFILSHKHMSIKSVMTEIWPEPVGFHQYCLHHFISNFNRRFKDPTLKNFLGMMCRETSKWKFNTWYSQTIDKDPRIKKWLEREPKEKYTFI